MLRRPLWGIHDGAEPTAGLATPALPQSRQVLTCAMAAVQKRLAQRDSHEIGLQAARTACLLVSASPQSEAQTGFARIGKERRRNSTPRWRASESRDP